MLATLRQRNFALLWLRGFLLGWLGQRMMSRWSIGLSSVAVGVDDLLIFNSGLLPILLGLRRAFHRCWRDHDLPHRQGSIAADEVS
jgi:hypothetical protein